MKIVKLKGGLGNQMFQYAFAKLVEKMTEEEIRLDYSAFQSLGKDKVRVPRIEKFKLSIQPASKDEIKNCCLLEHTGNSQTVLYRAGILLESKVNKKYFLEPNRAYINPEEIIHHDYFDGYWQSWRYVEEVKELLNRDFQPNYQLSGKTIDMKNVMENQNAVFIGVRRGDYLVEASHYGSFGTEYYQRALCYVSERVANPVFYVFSNDVEWCKSNLDWGSFNVEYREPEQQTNDFEELMLMASCKHAIIINSTYHWWGAAMIRNPDKIICCPEKWWFDDKPIDIIPNEWVKIRR